MNHMHYDRDITRIIYRHIIGTITPQEKAVLDDWLKADDEHRRFFDHITDTEMLRDEILSRSVVGYNRPAADMSRLIRSRKRARHMRFAMKAAAIVIVLIAAGAAWFFTPSSTLSTAPGPSPSIAATQAPITLDDIVAGTQKATITDADGNTIPLTADQSGSINPGLATTQSPDSRELCLDVPRGGEFKIILEDSTEVWLNSESTLRYPETFGAGERRVAVTGEAYFKVSKDSSRPFYVESDHQIIRVYGTSFNVRAYPDEDATFTTLETGAVTLRSNQSAQSGEILLAVGHQAILDHDANEIKMSVVDPETVTSWRHGRFVFDDQPLDRIMRDLSRWYNFQYEFSDPSLQSRVFMGGIHRYADFRTAIQILENCGDIHFTISPDNKVIISPADR